MKTKILPKPVLTLAVLGAAMQCLAASSPESYSFNQFGSSSSLSIPDGDASGVVDVRTIQSSAIVENITISLDISSQWNGDIYAYLLHGDKFAVLLNREGRTADSLYGYDDTGFNVKLSSNENLPDIHSYRMTLAPAKGDPVIGQWKADGRDVAPEDSYNNTPRTAGLNVLFGEPVQGDWVLFLSDANSGAKAQLNSWGMEINAIPEPGTIGLLLLGGPLLWLYRLKK